MTVFMIYFIVVAVGIFCYRHTENWYDRDRED